MEEESISITKEEASNIFAFYKYFPKEFIENKINNYKLRITEKMIRNLIILILISLCLNKVNAQNIILVDKGKSEYNIVIPEKANSNELIASKLLQDYIKKISACELPIIKDDVKSGKKEILIGLTNRSNDDSLKIKKKTLNEEGFYLVTKDEKLLIIGGSGAGVIYGVTGFLEDYLHCRKYSTAVEIIPHTQTISISAINDTQIPPTDIRILRCDFMNDTVYDYFRKIKENKFIWHDGTYRYKYVHTLPRILDTAKYFKPHPEYYSLINGKRIPDGQYCLSNPALLNIIINELKEQMALQPDLKYWSVSQNDNFSNCECDKCKAIDAEEGSPSGAMLRLVNEVAKVFPDKVISTLAYQYTRKPPLKTKPLDNVMIILCTIELNRSQPIETAPSAAEFCKEFNEWSKLTNKIMIWDYETQFSSLFAPFPLYNTLQPNIQYFTKNNVIGHLQQCSGKANENFGELKCYLISKLLWNPNVDVNALIDEFMKDFYGNAAPFIRQYFDMLHSECKIAGVKLGIGGNAVMLAQNILSENNMQKYNELFDNAEKTVADNMIVLDRVKAARLPIMYSTIEIAKTDLFGKRGWYNKVDNKYVVKKEMDKLLEDFYGLLLKDSIQTLTQRGLSPETYYKNTLKAIDISIDDNLAFSKKVVCYPEPNNKYSGLGVQLLTNGVKGTEDHHINWLGWEAEDVSIVIDLDTITKLNTIEINTLQNLESWIIHPSSVKCYTSNDSINYKLIDEIKYNTDNETLVYINTFLFKIKNNSARYIKFNLNAVKKLPSWHPNRGGKAWLFIDEITVK